VIILNLNFEQIKVVPAEKENKTHKKGIWNVFNENIKYNRITSEPVPYKQHCKWWETAFDKEYIYVILYQLKVAGYIRLTKEKTNSKEINEISVAIGKKFQNAGLGSFSYKIFEDDMKKFAIKRIVALTDYKNKLGQKFFEKNKFEKRHIRYVKDLKD